MEFHKFGKKTLDFGRTVRILDYAKKLKLEFSILHQLRLDSKTWKCIHFCFSLSVAALNFQSKSDICTNFPPSWSWWPIYIKSQLTTVSWTNTLHSTCYGASRKPMLILISSSSKCFVQLLIKQFAKSSFLSKIWKSKVATV